MTAAATAALSPVVVSAVVPAPGASTASTLAATAAVASAAIPSPALLTAATVAPTAAVVAALIGAPAIDGQVVAAGCIEAMLNAVRDRFSTVVEVPEAVPVAYDNEPPEALDGADAWIRFSAEAEPAELIEFGGTSPATRIFGGASATIYLRQGIGDAAAWALADAISDAFRAVTADDVIYDPPPFPILRAASGDRWALEVVIPFYHDCPATP